MKKFLFLLSGGMVCCFLSCNNEKTADASASDAVQKNLAASHTVDEAFQTGDISKIDSVVAADFVDHTPMGECNRDSLKNMITTMHKSSKDMKFEIIKELADSNYVMSWMRFSGTSDGSMGMPAGPYNMTAIETVRFKDGKAVEHWEFMEPQEVMKMMPQGAGADMKMMDNKAAGDKMSADKMESKDKMKGK